MRRIALSGKRIEAGPCSYLVSPTRTPTRTRLSFAYSGFVLGARTPARCSCAGLVRGARARDNEYDYENRCAEYEQEYENERRVRETVELQRR